MRRMMVAVMMGLAGAACAEDKTWPADYWQTVTNLVAAATPAPVAAAFDAPGASRAAATAAAYGSDDFDSRVRLGAVASGNAIDSFNTREKGTVLLFR